ncbi:hypothetical protein M378DRAFT_65316 [Amanita muscaria Koide BX008]|uniref:Tetraspanin Tsp2 n=1 Tax=Amanita muscaria (strain Koide BX008) TaxID=946122 RepID=A0A0C2TV71_AMAMK|nr:hypothetical protein M378DRAFT_65316 [Amanita muscaria Koide BX008]
MISESNTQPGSSSSHHGDSTSAATSTTNLFNSFRTPLHLSPSTQSLGDSSSLTVNYLPRKFSSTILNPANPRRRKNTAFPKSGAPATFPKRGGGVDAFRSGESRIPDPSVNGDDAYYGVDAHSPGAKTEVFGGQRRAKKSKWNKFKWILFVSNLLFTIYTLIGLIICLLTWFNVFTYADVVRVGNQTELVLCTLTSVVGLLTSLIGWSGILLNNRSFLAVYAFLTWFTFALLVTPGYVAYKKRTFNLEGKINSQWSRDLDTAGRLLIQNELQCCGYYNAFTEATISATCYSRSDLPGCKMAYLLFERSALKKFYSAAFGIVPLQIGVMVVALLCSNHVTYRFGKGMMPKAYRLDLASVAAIMDQYASQLAEQYGQDFASEVMAASRANLLQFDAMRSTTSVPYSSSTGPSPKASPYATTPVYQRHAKYDSLGSGMSMRGQEEELQQTEHERTAQSKPSGWF